MTEQVDPIPAAYRAATPYLIVDGAAEAIEFYKQAFGATESMKFPMPGGGVIVHYGDLLVGLDEAGNGLWRHERIARPEEWAIEDDTIVLSSHVGSEGVIAATRDGWLARRADIGNTDREQHTILAEDDLADFETGSVMLRSKAARGRNE